MRLPFRAQLASLLVANTLQQPVETSWSSNPIGPDGPWQGVEITVGIDQTLTLYPGTIFQTWLITPDYCDFNRSLGCPASSAGLYNSDKSLNALTGSGAGIQYQPAPWDMSRGLDVQGPEGTFWVDRMTVASGVNVPNVSIALANKPGLAYPDGKWYPLSAGCLGLGASGTVNQSFDLGDGTSIQASLIPGNLWDSGRTASNSFGMHIGSAVPGSSVPGSLQWGGYDRKRVLGDVLTTDLSGKDNTAFFSARLTDMSIEVIDGHSPFDFSSEEKGLLSSSGGVDVDVDGCSPYLTLGKATCDNIASHLPVTYNEDLGLYLWDVGSRRYERVTSSASALAFTLESKNPSGGVESIKVRVPFAHLNLTLSSPLRESDTPYFPCFTGGRQGATVLGRAFLQDAFLGANWGVQTWWLAQAPGPRAESRSVQEIKGLDFTIVGGDQDWAQSWHGTWTALEEEEDDGDRDQQTSSSPTPTSSPPSSAPIESGPNLPTGAIAGIGVGGGLAVLAVVGGLVYFCCRRRKKEKRAGQQPASVQEVQGSPAAGIFGQYSHDSHPGGEYYKPGATPDPPSEMYPGAGTQGSHQRHELG